MPQPRSPKRRRSAQRFEAEVARFLKSGGFHIEANARIAHPRQTDLYARADGIELVVEVKNRKRSIDVGDIDALRSRLRRTASDIVGVIFAASAITRGARSAVEADRTREILVFLKDDIDALRNGRANLRSLIERKRIELRSHGRVWLGPVGTLDYLNVILPRSTIEFRFKDCRSYFVCKGDHGHITFVREIPDPTWGTTGGDQTVLPLRLTLSTVDDLRNILGYLHKNFGLSSNGAFSIHQSEASWHGTGARDLLQTITNWRERYSEAALRYVHHSEDIIYIDRLRDGWIVLSARQVVHGAREGGSAYLDSSELAIGLGGVPPDSKPFLELCRYTGNEWAQFQHASGESYRTTWLRKRLKLRVLGTVVDKRPFRRTFRDGHSSVVGIVAKNPFYKKQSLPPELQDAKLQLRDLLGMELLLCNLKDRHDEGDVIDAYDLQGIETAHAHGANLVRPFGTWRRILKRAHARQTKEAVSRELESLLKKLKRRRER